MRSRSNRLSEAMLHTPLNLIARDQLLKCQIQRIVVVRSSECENPSLVGTIDLHRIAARPVANGRHHRIPAHEEETVVDPHGAQRHSNLHGVDMQMRVVKVSPQGTRHAFERACDLGRLARTALPQANPADVLTWPSDWMAAYHQEKGVTFEGLRDEKRRRLGIGAPALGDGETAA